MTNIPAAIDRLVALSKIALPEGQVLDGPPIVELEKTGVAIGYSPDLLAATSTEEGAGLESDVETFDVNCIAWERSGDADMKTIRDAAYATVAALDTAIAGDRRLGGAVAYARVRVVDLDQTSTTDGTWAVIAFAVVCRAFK